MYLSNIESSETRNTWTVVCCEDGWSWNNIKLMSRVLIDIEDDIQEDQEMLCLDANNVDQIRLRKLLPSDVDIVRSLCREWFPIDYPDLWYHEITTSSRFFSAVAIDSEEDIIGLIVAENKPQSRCNPEDRDLVSKYFWSPDPVVSYILSLGVVKERRREGIASILLNHLIGHLTGQESHACRAIFLHVLSTNQGAIDFYIRQGFQQHKKLPLYYLIKGSCLDGCSYVKYINSGHPPFTLSSLASSFLSSCRVSCFKMLRSPFIVCSLLSFYKLLFRKIFRSFYRKLIIFKTTLSLTQHPSLSSSQSSSTTKYSELINHV